MVKFNTQVNSMHCEIFPVLAKKSLIKKKKKLKLHIYLHSCRSPDDVYFCEHYQNNDTSESIPFDL